MSRIATRLIAAMVLAGFTLVASTDLSACCHHRRRCGGGCGYGGGGCGGGYGGGCGGGYCYSGYCYSGYGYGGYYTAMPAPLFPRLAFIRRNHNVPATVVMMPAQPIPVVNTAVARVEPAPAIEIVAAADAGTPNAMNHGGGGNE